MNRPEANNEQSSRQSRAVLQLTVHNRPGVMSEISALFSKRGFNLEGIAALPVADGKRSRVWLAVDEGRRVEQLIKHLQKLRSVIEVRLHTAEHEVFLKLEDFFKQHPEERPPEVAARNGDAA